MDRSGSALARSTRASLRAQQLPNMLHVDGVWCYSAPDGTLMLHTCELTRRSFKNSWCHLGSMIWQLLRPKLARVDLASALRAIHANLEQIFIKKVFQGDVVRNFLCALTVIALGCFSGNVALASSATFTISPNPQRRPSHYRHRQDFSRHHGQQRKAHSLLYNASNSAYSSGFTHRIEYTVNQTTTATSPCHPSLRPAVITLIPASILPGKAVGLPTHHFHCGSAGSGGSAKSCTFNGRHRQRIIR